MKIEYKGIEFDVEYYHQPYEPEVTYYSDGSGYPGCAESIELEKISHKGTDFLEFFEYEIEEIQELIIENLREN
jgi:hypothetical protein